MLSRISSSILFKSKNTFLGQVHQLSIKSSSVVSNRSFSTKKDPNEGYVDAPVDEKVAKIDTTLTPEQQEYVDALKRKYKGSKGERSLYRDVPRPDEIKGFGNFMPKMAPKAEALIDWALSHIPKRDGPRGTRKKRRMQLRFDIKRANDARRKKETHEAQLRRVQKAKRIREEIKAVREQAKHLAEVRALKLQILQQKHQQQK